MVIRFRLWSDGYGNKAGWYLDDIVVETLGTPGFNVDPLTIAENATPVMPAMVDMTMGNTGDFPTTYAASVIYNETDLLTENFDAGIPGTWTIVNNGNNSVTWADTTGKYGYNFDGTRFAWADGYQNYGPAETLMDDDLITPVIDASAYVGGALQLEFDQAFDADWNPGDTARVYVYDGTSWIMIYESWTDDGLLSWNGNGIHKVYDVSAYANANFQVKFHYIEGSLTSRGQYFAIDNFRIRASMSALGWLTIDGSEYTNGTAMPDADNLPSIIDVNMDATGLAEGTYTADILVTSTDAGNPSTTIPVTMNVVAGSTISGNVTYANTGMTPLNGCLVEFYNDASEMIFSTTTDAAGYYEFSGIIDGNYTIETSVSLPHTGFNIADAFQTRQYLSTGNPALNSLQLLAGDVTWDGFTNIADAFAMRQELAGGSTMWNAPDFVFETQSIIVSGSAVGHSYSGLCSGDINGDGTP